MIYLGVAIVLGLIALAVLLLALRLLIGDWILAWLRGTVGLTLLGGAALIAAAAWDLRGYEQTGETRPIATLSFNKTDDKHFSVSLVDERGGEQRYALSGDLWQLDVRVLKWFDAAARIGIKPGYRLERLSGRYLALEDEQKRPHTAVSLHSEQSVIDVWSWLQSVNRYFSVIEAQTANASYLPMVDGAVYSVGIDRNGAVVQALNERARLAMQQWQ